VDNVRIIRANGEVEDLPAGLHTEEPRSPMRRFILELPEGIFEGIAMSGGWVVLHQLCDAIFVIYPSVGDLLERKNLNANIIRWLDA